MTMILGLESLKHSVSKIDHYHIQLYYRFIYRRSSM